MSSYMGISLGIIGTAFIFAYISSSVNEKHGALQIFFMLTSVFTLSFESVLVFQMAKTDGLTHVADLLTGYMNFTVWLVPTIVIFYMLIYFIYSTLMKTTEKGKEAEGW